jgi:hypothetical protein
MKRTLLLTALLITTACGPRPVPIDDPPAKDPVPSEDAAAVAALEKEGVTLERADGKVVKASLHMRGGEVAPPVLGGPLERLTALIHLREVIIQNAAGLPAKALAGLASLQNLRSVSVNHCQIDDAALAALAKLPHLEALHFRASRVTGDGLAVLAKAPALRELDLGGCPGLDDDSLGHIAGLKKLEVLLLPNCPKVGDPGLGHVAGLTALRVLNLESTSAGDEGVKKLAALKSLKELNLSDTRVSDAGLEAIAQLPLEDLAIARTKAAGTGLGKFKKLLTVNMRGAPVTPATFDALAAVPFLRKLDLGGTATNDAGVEKLKAKTTLRELDISSTKVISAGLAHLEGLNKLQKVILSVDPAGDEETAIVPDAVEKLKKAMPGLKVEE